MRRLWAAVGDVWTTAVCTHAASVRAPALPPPDGWSVECGFFSAVRLQRSLAAVDADFRPASRGGRRALVTPPRPPSVGRKPPQN